jgi:hypothetical protein
VNVFDATDRTHLFFALVHEPIQLQLFPFLLLELQEQLYTWSEEMNEHAMLDASA